MDDQRTLRLARTFERFWDDLMSGRRGRPGNELDPDVIEAARRLQALSQPLSTDATFEANLWEELMNSHTLDASIPLRQTLLPHPNGHELTPRRPLPQTGVKRLPWADHRRIVQLAAAAMMLLLALGGWLLAEVIGPSGTDDGGRTIVPAAFGPDATPEAAFEFLWQTAGDPADPMENATNLAISPDGTLWVPDGRNGRFQIFSPEGELLEIWGSEGTGEGQFDFLIGGPNFGGYGRGAIAFAPDGSFYVADTGNYRIQKFGPDREFISTWGSEGTGDGQFAGASDLVVDAEGRVYVVDAYRDISEGVDAVQVFDADGNFLDSWGPHGREPGQLQFAVGITLDQDGSILIAEYQNNRVQRFTPEGDYLRSWGDMVTAEGRMNGPFDVAVDSRGNVYEVDYNRNMVQVFDREGRFLISWGGTGTDDGEFTGPVAIAVDGAGNVYVTDDEGRLQKFHINRLPEPAASPVASPVA